MDSEKALSIEDITKAFEKEIEEAAEWFGGWDELRKKIDELEQLDNEKAGDKFLSRD